MSAIKQKFQEKYLKIAGGGTRTLKKSRSPEEPTANKLLGSFMLHIKMQ